MYFGSRTGSERKTRCAQTKVTSQNVSVLNLFDDEMVLKKNECIGSLQGVNCVVENVLGVVNN